MTAPPAMPLGLDVEAYLPDLRRMYGRRFADQVNEAGLLEEDVMQAILLGVIVRNGGTCPYDPRRGTKPTTYLYMVMWCVVANEIAKHQNHSHHHRYGARASGCSARDDADERTSSGREGDVALADLATVPGHYGTPWAVYRSRLAGECTTTDADAEVVSLALEGHTQTEIVKRTGMSGREVRRILVVAREALREERRYRGTNGTNGR